jgi:hypothetical protein
VGSGSGRTSTVRAFTRLERTGQSAHDRKAFVGQVFARAVSVCLAQVNDFAEPLQGLFGSHMAVSLEREYTSVTTW